MRNGFWRGKNVRKEAAPVERAKRWSRIIGQDVKIERRMECLKLKRFLS